MYIISHKIWSLFSSASLQWCHNGRDGVSNHQLHECLLSRLFNAQIKENIKAPRHWPLWWPVNSLHKGPLTRKMFPFDDVIMYYCRGANVVNRRIWTISSYYVLDTFLTLVAWYRQTSNWGILRKWLLGKPQILKPFLSRLCLLVYVYSF